MLTLICFLAVLHSGVAQPETYGLLSDVVNKTINEIVSKLDNVHFENTTVGTKGQEFGGFKLDLFDVNFVGLNTLRAEIIEMSIVPKLSVKNITMFIDRVDIISRDYFLSGSIQFPFGDKIIPLSGSGGEFRTSLKNFRISVSVDISPFPPHPVENVVLEVNSTGITIHLDDLMGGGDVGWAFNTVLDDVTIVAFEYYKDALIRAFDEPLKIIIGCALCEIHQAFCPDRELIKDGLEYKRKISTRESFHECMLMPRQVSN